MDNKEVDQAFSELKKKGLVKHFGVSNFAPQAIEYLKDGTKISLEINQMQLELGHLNLVREVMNTDVFTDEGMPTGLDLFFYMKRNKMALQCWSPYLIGESGTKRTSLFSDPNYEELRKELQALADKYHSTPSGIATAFLIGLGENVQVVTGSVTISHIEEELEGTKVKLSKEDFYALYRSTGNLLP
jgi:predicted oxidoreductase